MQKIASCLGLSKHMAGSRCKAFLASQGALVNTVRNLPNLHGHSV